MSASRQAAIWAARRAIWTDRGDSYERGAARRLEPAGPAKPGRNWLAFDSQSTYILIAFISAPPGIGNIRLGKSAYGVRADSRCPNEIHFLFGHFVAAHFYI